jgi:hypothetical protein
MDLPELDMALRVIRRARLMGRVAHQLDETGLTGRLPQVAVDQLAAASAMANARVRLARWELDRIAWAMGKDVSTPLVLMKGCAYEALSLPRMKGRIFADVDLMTGESALGNVENVLNSYGWMTASLNPYDDNYYRRWTHELPPMTHVEREVEIDLHHNFVPRTSRLKPNAQLILERCRELPDSRYQVLAEEDLALHAMVHLMFDSDLGDKLRDLVDIADLVGAFSAGNPGFWSTLEARARELGLERPAFYSLRYVKRLLETDVPNEVVKHLARWAPPAPVLKLMDRLVDEALFPQHPDNPSRAASVARLLLYVRSHWLRMPPWLLAYHLANKFVRKRILRR